MKLLVAGHDRVDAGKTTFSTGLLARVDGVGFKPRAGNDYWFDHDDYRRAIEAGRLYGKDARRLVEHSAAEVEPEDINPIHRLWRPDPGPGSGILGRPHKVFVVDRVAEEYVVNVNAEVPPSARECLPLDGATVVSSLAGFNERMTERYLPVLADLAERIEATDTAVVESYGDTAIPIRDVGFDAVAVVEPGRARVYDGDRYAKACTVVSGSMTDGQLEQRAGDVTDVIDPKATVWLPALTKSEQSDVEVVAQAYEPAYDALLDVARGDR
jgi:predicted P-loop ATPase/GTPase